MVAGDQRLVHTPFVHSGYWSPCAPLVWNQGFLTPLGELSISTNSVKALDIRFSSPQFRKQHPWCEKATQTNIYEIVTDLRMEQGCLQHRMETLESSLIKVQEQLRALPGLIRTVIIQQHLAYQKLVTTTPGNTSSINQPMTLKFEEHKS
ncbi:unnamed protein product [Schistosoma margrebowiei]|uniref:Uncharacterized protein n=1 Tax=Schistosoma margrebowiei TaxID=48269 RepID=A0A183MN89_9TREM|nr:unnamed protein product [Schistosoma margrebowiei]